MEPVIVFLGLFLLIFAIVYLALTTRNKERLALIERDKDVSIFMKTRNNKTPPAWKIIILALGMLAVGVGIGILLGALLNQLGLKDEVAYPASIFLTAGSGLLFSFFIIKKLDNKQESAK